MVVHILKLRKRLGGDLVYGIGKHAVLYLLHALCQMLALGCDILAVETAGKQRHHGVSYLRGAAGGAHAAGYAVKGGLGAGGTYLVTVSVSSGSASMPELPTLPPINTEKPIADDEELFLYACIDAFNGCRTSRVLQCLPKEGTVRMAALSGSGTVLCYLYDEMKEYKPSSPSELTALLGLAPSTAAEKVIIFDIPSACVFRPAFNTDCTSGEMPDTQCALSDEQQAFIDSMIIAAAEKKIAFTVFSTILHIDKPICMY